MKLALIRRQFAATGGAEFYLQRLLGALAQAGHELHLFAEAWGQPPAGVTLRPVRIAGSRAQRPVRFADAVEAAVGKEEFDCVFSLERTRRQDVYRAGDGVHRVWLERRRQFAPWWRKPFIGLGGFHRNMVALEAETFDPARTRHVIVNSEMVKREILQHFKFPEERIHLVRNGVDVARMQSGRRAETRARFGVKDDEFLLLFAGSGWERKGLRFVIQAHEELGLLLALVAHSPARWKDRLTREIPFAADKVKLLVVGKGKAPPARGGLISFAGAMPDIENAYAAADLFLFLPIYEPSSNVVFEALAAGLPVVTSPFNGAGEILKADVNGSIVHDFQSPEVVAIEVLKWLQRRTRPVRVDRKRLDLERNVAETLAVLELAARERRVQA